MMSSSYAKKDKSWCFRRNAPNWTREHKCKNKKIYLCEKNDNDNKNGSNGDEQARDISFDIETYYDESNIQKSDNTPTLSLAIMAGIYQPQTLKVYRCVKKTKVTMLIDSGSSYNFIDTRIVKKLNIFIYPTSKFQVSFMGNKITSVDEKCHKVELNINFRLITIKLLI